MKCRVCSGKNFESFVDLGAAPPSNAYLKKEDLSKGEKWLPLRVFVCLNCWLVQTEDFASSDDLFTNEYAYFSSFSASWLKHAENFSIKMIEKLALNSRSFVIEVGANDGYLLQFFKRNRVSCLGVEPTKSTAASAREKGIKIVEDFFGVTTAREIKNKFSPADLIVANNVLAHVPDLIDFLKGIETLLKTNGVATFEFPQLLNLINYNQFDTVYHEHFSYLSLVSLETACEKVGLSIFDVEKLHTHGGSLRVFVQRTSTGTRRKSNSYREILKEELQFGIKTQKFYETFQKRCELIKDDVLEFLINAKKSGHLVCGYGAAAKGNTLLNYAGIKSDLIKFIVDMNPAKQGTYMPGSRIPILSPAVLKQTQPDYIVILPWNLREEIYKQLDEVLKIRPKLVTFIPHLQIRD